MQTAKTGGVESLGTRLVHDANVNVIQVTVVITMCKDILIVQRSHVAFVYSYLYLAGTL